MSTYDVKIWDPKKIGDTAKGRWRVRWAAAGREHCRSFAAKPLADGFITKLKAAIRDHQPFDETTGLPARPGHASRPRTWYEHARAYAEMKWPGQAATSRRSSAEALTTVTIALAPRKRGAPDPEVVRRALYRWAFNPGTRQSAPPPGIAAAQDWVAAASQPVAALEDPAILRAVLGACARTCAGKPAAATTQRRKRAVFYNALGYAVEQGLLGANPVDRIQWKAPEVAETVDRRVVASPAQAQALLAAVRAQGPRGAHLEAFFGCLYYAAMRPSEVVSLREGDCHLPARGWGRIDLAASEPRAGRGLDRRRRRPRGPRPQAPRRARDAVGPHPARAGRAAARPPPAVRHRPRGAAVPHRPRRGHPAKRLQRDLAGRPDRRVHHRPARLPAGPPPLRPQARRGVPLAERRGPGHRGRPSRRAQRRRPAQGLRPLHRRAGQRRQPAHHQRPYPPDDRSRGRIASLIAVRYKSRRSTWSSRSHRLGSSPDQYTQTVRVTIPVVGPPKSARSAATSTCRCW